MEVVTGWPLHQDTRKVAALSNGDGNVGQTPKELPGSLGPVLLLIPPASALHCPSRLPQPLPLSLRGGGLAGVAVVCGAEETDAREAEMKNNAT